ncbi:MAG: HesA/MoeB/ThiF family protein [Flavobacteriaceae bacterium]|nr:HesA/MoeB/ThiF family protein [Flavobacteriaceae bacterium]
MSQISKSDLFKRQITLSEIGEAGQQKLQEAKILVVGCGGLGSPISVYLASSGIGKLHLIDFDTVDISNLHRQVFYSLKDIGKLKSECLSNFIQQRSPFTEVSFSREAITKENAIELISEYDVIVDGTDSLPTKYLLNDACVILEKPLVYGSLYKFDGYVSIFNLKQEDGSFSANLRDAFPDMNTTTANCEEAGTLNAIVGMIATAQVNEVLKIITGIGKPLTNELLIYNVLENTQLKMKLSSNIFKDEILSLFNTQNYFDSACGTQNPDWQISPKQLKNKIGNPNLELIAVLPNLKLPFKVHQTLPIQEFDASTLNVDKEKIYVMVCQKGFNSYKATEQLKEKYPSLQVFNLTGGIRNY